MAFTYTPSATPDDVTIIRYHIGDTTEATAIYSDAEINMVLSIEGAVNLAVISLIKGIIARIAMEPDMTADWLRVEWRRSTDNWKTLLAEKRREFGLGAVASSSGQHAYRADSFQNESPDWDSIFADWLDDDCFT
jgi:hypothetical protein